MGIWLHKCESEIGIHMDDVQKKREKRKNLLNLDGKYDIIKINCQCCRIMERRVENPGFWENVRRVYHLKRIPVFSGRLYDEIRSMYFDCNFGLYVDHDCDWCCLQQEEQQRR